MDALPVTSAVRSATDSLCTGQELRKTPREMKAVFAISKSLHNHFGLSAEHIARWKKFRNELKNEMLTDRCKRAVSGTFCCKICLPDGKSMFCFQADFLSESRTLLDQRILNSKSRQSKKKLKKKGLLAEGNVLYGRDEVTLDLFAATCKKPMQEQACSEFVRRTCPVFTRGLLNFSYMTFCFVFTSVAINDNH